RLRHGTSSAGLPVVERKAAGAQERDRAPAVPLECGGGRAGSSGRLAAGVPGDRHHCQQRRPGGRSTGSGCPPGRIGKPPAGEPDLDGKALTMVHGIHGAWEGEAMSVPRTARLREEIKKEASDIIQRRLKDPRIGFTTVTDVEVSQDLRHVKIFVSVLG